jgi:threonine/homoserine/homoserine lactone efflux protein
MLSFLLAGAVLGLSAGFAPGPLLALIVSETLEHDIKAGVKVAFAPVLTDLPIITVTLFILAELSRFQHILGMISLVGGCFVLFLGMKNLQTRGVHLSLARSTPRSLQKGILVNIFSPHPYLFWFSVGGPTTIKAMSVGPGTAITFVLSFYLLLVGSKVFLALLVGKSRSFLQGDKYIFTMRLLGCILLILAGFLFRDGLRLLGIF